MLPQNDELSQSYSSSLSAQAPPSIRLVFALDDSSNDDTQSTRCFLGRCLSNFTLESVAFPDFGSDKSVTRHTKLFVELGEIVEFMNTIEILLPELNPVLR